MYYGDQTKKAIDNFPFPLHMTSLLLIYAIVEIKIAAARANYQVQNISVEIQTAIEQACDEILQGKYDSEFVTPAIQGGAGTSINMNVNEVIATRATEILQENSIVHPNNHVNCSQSTNDVNPSALRIVCIRLQQKLIEEVKKLTQALSQRSVELKTVKKLGRTHMQDAVPTTIGDEFAAYAMYITRAEQRIIEAFSYLNQLNLGGTAIGTGINASESYKQIVYKQLQEITGVSVKPGDNLMALTSSMTDFVYAIDAVYCLCIDLAKIANDIRFLSSGLAGGIGELSLGKLQNGSSIMPGKVNPIIPESMNQICCFVAGAQHTIHDAASLGNLELNVMFPVLADSLITALQLITAGVRTFTVSCIQTLEVNKTHCRTLLEQSSAYATCLTPILGYDLVTALVEQAKEEHKTFREVVREHKEIKHNKEVKKILENR